MRARWLKPEFFRDRKIGVLGPGPALLYAGLWVIADDGGTAPCDPDRLKGELFYSWPGVGVEEIGSWLGVLEAAGRIVRYVVGDDSYCTIPKFNAHQKIKNPSSFRYPPPGVGLPQPYPSPTPTSILVSYTPRHQDKDKDRASPVANASPLPPKLPKTTWLTPYADLWKTHLGGLMAMGQGARYLKPLEAEHGREVTLRALGAFLSEHSGSEARYVSLAKFAQTFGAWRDGGKPPHRETQQERNERAIDAWADAQKGGPDGE